MSGTVIKLLGTAAKGKVETNVTSKISAQVKPASLWDRVKEGSKQFSEKLANRFFEAREEFFFVINRETAWKKRDAFAVQGRSLTVTGFLMLERGKGFLPLHEGLNAIVVDEGKCFLAEENSAADYQIRITSQEVRLDTLRGQATRQILESNQTLVLGEQRYLVKLLPETYWTKRPYLFPVRGQK